MSAVFVYIVAANDEEAARIGRALVEERLCACVNVLGGVRSFYRWQGRMQDEREVALIAKTTDDRVAAVAARVGQLHSYEVPCVVATPIAGGNPSFLDWIAAETGKQPD
ncbi:MAG: hypothetical protein RL477_745 [Pseudomonadota bacterium]|jgi:periplasmic divalent cation tolerance protein